MFPRIDTPEDDFFSTDEKFDELFPESVRRIARRHWTPLRIAGKSATFLAASPGSKILDIGSGAGKFCLTAAHQYPESFFYGVEQRKSLTNHALKAKKLLSLPNAFFMHGNFTELDLSQFTGFYFYNSFFENLDDMDRIDDAVSYSEDIYMYYVGRLHDKLAEMPTGTKVVTYHSLKEEIPRSYSLVETSENEDLNFWIKG